MKPPDPMATSILVSNAVSVFKLLKPTFFNEDASMLCTNDVTHLKDYVLEAGCLGGWPVYSADQTVRWDGSHINHEISNLTIERIGASKPQVRPAQVNVAVDNT